MVRGTGRFGLMEGGRDEKNDRCGGVVVDVMQGQWEGKKEKRNGDWGGKGRRDWKKTPGGGWRGMDVIPSHWISQEK